MSAGSILQRFARVTSLAGTQALRRLACGVLWVVFAMLIVLLALEVPHPAHWDRWIGVVILHKVSGFLLAPVTSTLQRPDAIAFFLFVLTILCSILLIVLDTNLYALRRWLLGKKRWPS